MSIINPLDIHEVVETICPFLSVRDLIGFSYTSKGIRPMVGWWAIHRLPMRLRERLARQGPFLPNNAAFWKKISGCTCVYLREYDGEELNPRKCMRSRGKCGIQGRLIGLTLLEFIENEHRRRWETSGTWIWLYKSDRETRREISMIQFEYTPEVKQHMIKLGCVKLAPGGQYRFMTRDGTDRTTMDPHEVGRKGTNILGCVRDMVAYQELLSGDESRHLTNDYIRALEEDEGWQWNQATGMIHRHYDDAMVFGPSPNGIQSMDAVGITDEKMRMEDAAKIMHQFDVAGITFDGDELMIPDFRNFYERKAHLQLGGMWGKEMYEVHGEAFERNSLELEQLGYTIECPSAFHVCMADQASLKLSQGSALYAVALSLSPDMRNTYHLLPTGRELDELKAREQRHKGLAVIAAAREQKGVEEFRRLVRPLLAHLPDKGSHATKILEALESQTERVKRLRIGEDIEETRKRVRMTVPTVPTGFR